MDPALSRAFEEGWPAAEYRVAGGFLVGRGLGAGGRVSSARATGPWVDADINAAIACHRGWDQVPMFRVFACDTALQNALTARGLRRHTPTAILHIPVAALTDQALPHLRALTVWPPLAIQRRIWEAGNITPARQAVMQRAAVAKTSVLGRLDDRAAGAAFVAALDDIAMIHAIEVLPGFRRRGLAAWMIRQSALWAADQGATRLALAVSHANTAARALYDGMGFALAADYAYYDLPA